MRRIPSLTLALAAAVVACDGDGPSGPRGSGVEGSYRGQHRFILAGIELTCNGSMVVINAAGGQLHGTLTIDPCPTLEIEGGTTTFAGTITSVGNATFTVPDQDAIIDELRQEGCNVTRVEPIGQLQLTWRVDMTRTT